MKHVLRTLLTMTMAIVLLVAFSSTKQVDAATKKATYKIKKYDKSQTFKGTYTLKDRESYELVVLNGKSAAIKKINSTLKKECNKVLKNMPQDYAQDDYLYITSNVTYENIYKSKVTYNKNGIISIRVSYSWFQGGVADYGDKCYTFSLKTGKQLSLLDVCKGTNQSLTKQIINSLIKKYGKDCFDSDLSKKISAKKVDFYLKPGNKAVVTFDKYEIAVGAAGAFTINLKSKYK